MKSIQELVFATGNENKVKEISSLLPITYKLQSLKDIGCHEDIPEPFPTLEENSRAKAIYVVQHYNRSCFSEDSGLEVDALNGEPGVRSARYAGPEKNHDANMDLLLQKLKDKEDRSAQFRAVITLLIGDHERQFEGIIRGKIVHQKLGTGGFGYDPIFAPDGYNGKTFAQMSLDEKKQISHRGLAFQKLISYLKSI